MASVKSQGSSSNGRDSPGQRLGVKVFGGAFVTSGSIIVRQRGTKFLPGRHVGLGSDHTLFATSNGVVCFEYSRSTLGRRGGRRRVSVLPQAASPVA